MAENPSVSDKDTAENAAEIEVSGRPVMLENVLQQTVDRFTSSIGLSLFKKHYCGMYKQDRAGIRAIHHQFVKNLHSKITSELRADIDEQNLPDLLKTLDGLVAASEDAEKDQMEAWRPSGNPAKDLTPHKITVKLKAKEELQEMLRKLQQEDEVLKAAVAKKREILTELEQQLDNKLRHYDKAASACKQLPMPELIEYLTKTNVVNVLGHDSTT